jgi:nucleotide-binding universal stress UspA family protein
MRRVLVAVDGSKSSDRAVEEAVKTVKHGTQVEVHLVNVQPRVLSDDALAGLRKEDIDRYYYEQSSKALSWAEKIMRENSVPFTSHRIVGPAAQSIVAQARELQCDAIVMGTRGLSRINGLSLGSVSMKVLHLSDRPVTLVRGDPPVEFTGRLSAS